MMISRMSTESIYSFLETLERIQATKGDHERNRLCKIEIEKLLRELKFRNTISITSIRSKVT